MYYKLYHSSYGCTIDVYQFYQNKAGQSGPILSCRIIFAHSLHPFDDSVPVDFNLLVSVDVNVLLNFCFN